MRPETLPSTRSMTASAADDHHTETGTGTTPTTQEHYGTP